MQQPTPSSSSRDAGTTRVLVTGGTGYIGSHTALALVEAGYDVVLLDDLSNSKESVLGRLETILGRTLPLHVLDVRDTDAVEKVLDAEGIDAVVHFAGYKAVGESVAQPLRYYDNNIGGAVSLVTAMQRLGVHTLVFSSSATVYGPDAPVPMTEDLPTSATNPYGWTKVMIEQILRDLHTSDSRWRIALLRYFNPVGAHPSGTIGEDPTDIPNNLMPFLAQVAVGRRERLQVFGDDYDTPDGTGVRDYIHVDDLAAGHVRALDRLLGRPSGDGDTTGRGVHTWNLGTGRGTSVLELTEAFERASGRSIPRDVVARRPGDIAASYADPTRAAADLGWRAERTVDDMCESTWRWQSGNPQGYPDGRTR